MEKLVYVEEGRKNEIVADAVDRHAECVVTSRGGTGWRISKSHFDSSAPRGRLLLSAPKADKGDAYTTYRPGERVSVTFRRGHKKSMFATIVLAQEAESDCADLAGRVELQWPDALQELQRRAYHRASPPGRRVHVRYWPGGVSKRPEMENEGNRVLNGVLLDISAGGMRVVTTDVELDSFNEGDAIGCAFSPRPRGEVLVLDGIFRHIQPEVDGTRSIGIQFVGLEATDHGRRTLSELARLVTDYQRGHARQRRTELAGSVGRR
jgi:c-di-GMP-binding flagellar brake protein YcgR